MIPKEHPRYESLKQRELLVKGYKSGVTALAGLVAYGRGEAFDYLLGEKTIKPALDAIRVAAAVLILSKNPVISVNGNTAVLCSEDMVKLSKVAGAKLEVNLFHRSEERAKKIEDILIKNGAGKVYGVSPDRELEGVSSERRKVDSEGIYSGDVILVALEDGDRTEALVKQGKTVIAIDLNPLSRTSLNASITIVDNVVRAMPELVKFVSSYKSTSQNELEKIAGNFDNSKNIKATLSSICEKLNIY